MIWKCAGGLRHRVLQGTIGRECFPFGPEAAKRGEEHGEKNDRAEGNRGTGLPSGTAILLKGGPKF